MYRHEKIYNLGSTVRTTVACSHCHLKAGLEPCPQCNEISVYCLNFNETWHLSFVVNLKFIKQFCTSYKKWRHIVTIPFHFEIIVLKVFQLAWITMYYATLKIKGDLVIKHVTYE